MTTGETYSCDVCGLLKYFRCKRDDLDAGILSRFLGTCCTLFKAHKVHIRYIQMCI